MLMLPVASVIPFQKIRLYKRLYFKEGKAKAFRGRGLKCPGW